MCWQLTIQRIAQPIRTIRFDRLSTILIIEVVSAVISNEKVRGFEQSLSRPQHPLLQGMQLAKIFQLTNDATMVSYKPQAVLHHPIMHWLAATDNAVQVYSIKSMVWPQKIMAQPQINHGVTLVDHSNLCRKCFDTTHHNHFFIIRLFFIVDLVLAR